jgi:hypothetical protein
MLQGMRQFACLTVLAMLLFAAPAAARAPSHGERVAAANAFAKRTLGFDRQQRAADGRARQALATRRGAAQGCLAVFQSAPPARFEDLKTIYFEYLSGALWSVDAPIFRSWIADLRHSKRIDRSPVLARAADALRRGHASADFIYRAFPDACATVTAWRDAGWSAAAAPPALHGGGFVPPPGHGDAFAQERAGARELVRYARSGAAARKILRRGTDEPDERVHEHTGCDAIGALLFPVESGVCTAVG